MEEKKTDFVCLNLSNGGRLMMQCLKNEKGEWERKDKYLERMKKPQNPSEPPADKGKE